VRDGGFDYVISCVPPDVAEEVPTRAGEALRPTGLWLDWNTVRPDAKRRIAGRLEATTVDVALLDSLDAAVERPQLAVSGPRAEEAARLLSEHGFDARVAGDEVGDAAALKYLRSMFMKGLEALVLEYASLAFDREGEPIVRASLGRTLGETFVAFMDVLLTTNRVHAERRGDELEGALAFFADGADPAVARAAVDVLRRAARVWADEDAPPAGSSPDVLADHLQGALWPARAST
jgi:hypothetical protein